MHACAPGSAARANTTVTPKRSPSLLTAGTAQWRENCANSLETNPRPKALKAAGACYRARCCAAW
jgi:Ni,Fe-hydrogenase III small subunit